MSRDSVRHTSLRSYRVLNGTREKRVQGPKSLDFTSSDAMPELPRNNIAEVIPSPSVHVPKNLRQGVIKELNELVAQAHRSINTYTEELRKKLHHQELKVDKSDNEAVRHTSLRSCRVPKGTREKRVQGPKSPDLTSSDAMPELPRNNVAEVIPSTSVHVPKNLRQGVIKELNELVAQAHRSINTYTEELGKKLQHQELKLDKSDNEAVKYGCVPKGTREKRVQGPKSPDLTSSDAMPELPRNNVAEVIPSTSVHVPKNLRQGVIKELNLELAAQAHRSSNTYTEELRKNLQHQEIMLKVDDSDNEAMRYGRVPHGTREKRVQGPKSPDLTSSDAMPELPRNNVAEVILSTSVNVPEYLRRGFIKELTELVAQAHRRSNTYTEELRKNLQHQDIMLKVDESDSEGSDGDEVACSTNDPFTNMRYILWSNVALQMTPVVKQVVDFANNLPTFHTLLQDDQLILIKRGFFEVWLTRVTTLFYGTGIVFDNGTIITQQQFGIVYDIPFAKSMLSYMQSLIKMRLNTEEMELFTATLLVCPHRAGLSDINRISTLHRALTDDFHQIVVSRGGNVRLEAFAAATNEVRKMGLRHDELLAWCRENWPRLVVPALFSEIFDIPKIEADPIDIDRVATISQVHG